MLDGAVKWFDERKGFGLITNDEADCSLADKHKTKDQLIDELMTMRRRIAALEAAQSKFDRLHEPLSQDSENLLIVIKDLMITLASTVDLPDSYRTGHQKRVAELACEIATEMDLPDEHIEKIELAALVNDIGKVSVSADLLTRPDRLRKTKDTISRKSHSQVGYDLLVKAQFPQFTSRIILEHHERSNGSGYPNCMSGDDIILEARIIAGADVVEAITSQRSNGKARDIDEALKEISMLYQTLLYDAHVVDACVRITDHYVPPPVKCHDGTVFMRYIPRISI
jgi:putative nucleotidyltransferase with HDIG domain